MIEWFAVCLGTPWLAGPQNEDEEGMECSSEGPLCVREAVICMGHAQQPS